VSGSISCEEAAGGGQTLSWNMDPDSEARARSRCGGVSDVEGGGKAADKDTFACVCDDADCECENERRW
jgi:hypothetical protein